MNLSASLQQIFRALPLCVLFIAVHSSAHNPFTISELSWPEIPVHPIALQGPPASGVATGFLTPENSEDYFSQQEQIANLRRQHRQFKNAIVYPFTKNGLIDIGCAWALGLGIVLMHEVGHATMADFLYGPGYSRAITIGSTSGSTKPLAQFGRLIIDSLNPFNGGSTRIYFPLQSALYKKNLVLLAGPLFGLICSTVALRALRKKKGLSITKAMAGFFVFLQTFGVSGIGGINKPGTDFYKIWHGV